jgi:hypothetical protein
MEAFGVTILLEQINQRLFSSKEDDPEAMMELLKIETIIAGTGNSN